MKTQARIAVLAFLAASSPVAVRAGDADDVRGAEIAFARAFADRDAGRFFSFVAQDARFFSATQVLSGKAAVMPAGPSTSREPRLPFAGSLSESKPTPRVILPPRPDRFSIRRERRSPTSSRSGRNRRTVPGRSSSTLPEAASNKRSLNFCPNFSAFPRVPGVPGVFFSSSTRRGPRPPARARPRTGQIA